MKINLKPGNYVNVFNCPIAKGLRRKLIFATVGPFCWHGLFLGFIPVSGPISQSLNWLAMNCEKKEKVEIKVKLGWRRFS